MFSVITPGEGRMGRTAFYRNWCWQFDNAPR